MRAGGSWQAAWVLREWEPLTLGGTFTGIAEWKASPDGDSVELRFDVSGSVTGDTALTSTAIPADFRPSGDFPIVAAPTYVDPAAARGQCVTYASSSGLLRATSPGATATRMRGRAFWKLG